MIEDGSGSQCVWLLGPLDEFNPALELEMRELAGITNFARVGGVGLADTAKLAEIFGPEPAREWCYHYERMAAAQQAENWAGVLALWDEAQAAVYKPNDQIEMMPVLEALGERKAWAEAVELTRDIYRKQTDIAGMACHLWEGWLAETEISGELLAEVEELLEDMRCGRLSS